MTIQDCQQFEQRLQNLMDSRIDPETDESVCSHAAVCDECHESLMGYSLLHTNYLQDSDSMKIKLENLGLHEVFALRRPLPRRSNRWFAIVTGVAAMLLVCLGIMGSDWIGEFGKGRYANTVPSPAVAMNSADDLEEEAHHAADDVLTPVSLHSLVRVHGNLGDHDLYQYSTDLPGLRPLKAISYCLSWVHDSWFGQVDGNEVGVARPARPDSEVLRSNISPIETYHLDLAFVNVLAF